ncbi:excisionase family DNA-binding protein [Catenulispora sp. NF23]|uniref:Excisionase family DNA-binding protein n=1 Tax=Catenulispora pinistramenti TaxID=2705254 RepID=A0ABS5KJ30_9ACTN|nr:excisionase family DNA-binding protein [Catenulispora pinistramenti]MBS2546392.1 excisionase family DNA-binding protein [Catenulispora pinistramenti]
MLSAASRDHGNRRRRRLDLGQSLHGQGSVLGVGERYIRRLVENRSVPATKLGRHVRIRRSALDAYASAGLRPARVAY